MSQHPRVGRLAEIAFPAASAVPPSNASQDVGEVAGWAKENPDGLIVIDGHADRTGQPAASVRLALQRAQVVRDQLVDIGVDPDQIVIAGFAADAPGAVDRGRVVVWGTHQDLGAVVAAHRSADTVLWSPLARTFRPPVVAGR